MDIIDQALDMLYEDENIKEKIIKPVKKKAYPYLLGGAIFNFVILILLLFIVFKINNLNRKIKSFVG